MALRTALKNRQRMWYAIQLDGVFNPVYATDADGNIIYDTIDGQQVARETGNYEQAYTKPVEFWGSIGMSDTGNWTDNYGNAKIYVYGIDIADYDATLIMSKDEIPIEETSLIWFQHEPKYKDEEQTIVDPLSADYHVRRVAPSINQVKYLLRRLTRGTWQNES